MKQESSNKIFLIGNGFDLGHKLKTDYGSFIRWYLNESLKQALESGKNQFEDHCIEMLVASYFSPPGRHTEALKSLNSDFEKGTLSEVIVKKLPNPHYRGFNIAIKAKNQFINKILTECINAEWNGIEHEIYSSIERAHHEVRTNTNGPDIRISRHYQEQTDVIKEINQSVDCLKINLVKYLKTQNQPSIERTSNWFNFPFDHLESKDEVDTRPAAIFLNFNYTTFQWNLRNLLMSRYRDKVSSIDIIPIHGTIDDQNDVVFGVGDEQNEFYSIIESKYSDEWLKCMKSFHYFRNKSYQYLLGFTALGPYEIYVMGHSCSITDRTLLNMLFENKHCKKIHVYHYDGISSYTKTAYNIARNFRDKVKLREVLMPFNEYLKM